MAAGAGFLPSGWLLTILDHDSCKAFAFFLKNKRAETVLKAFKPLFDKHKPLVVIGDKGSEGASIRKLPFSVFYLTTTKGSTTPIERFNRALISKLNLLFRLEGKTGWKKKVTSVPSTYNNTEHVATWHMPNEVFALNKFSTDKPKFQDWELKPGDRVRKVVKVGVFAAFPQTERLHVQFITEKQIGRAHV